MMKMVAPEKLEELTTNENETTYQVPKTIKLGSYFSRHALNLLGRPIPGKTKLLFLVYSAAVLMSSLQMIIFLIVKWSSVELRFKALENLNVSVLCFFILLDFGLYPGKIQALMAITDGPIYIYKMPLSDEMKKMKFHGCQKDVSVQNQFAIIVFIYYIANFTIPVIYSFITIVSNSPVIVEDLPMMNVYWLPVPMDSILLYFAQLLIQSLYGIFLCIGYTGWFVLFLSSLIHIQHEIQVLCQFLREMDDRLFSGNSAGREDFSMRKRELSGKEYFCKESIEQNRRLKFYLKEIYEHHSAVIRAIKTVNESSSSLMYMYNQMTCFEICINMFLYFRNEDVERYQSLITSLVVLTLISIIGIFGQRLINESDSLIREFSECSWIDKPEWFKKSLRMMMMMAAYKPLQIKPVGMFVINLQNSSRIVQAAYSYFNVMRTLKDK